MLVWNTTEEEAGGTRKCYHVTWLRTRCGNTIGRQADIGEGRGQEQMDELLSREMEKEHPKLN